MLVINRIEAMYYASKDNRDRKKQKPIPVEKHNKDTRGQSFETVLLNYYHQMKKEER
jgi:hypothetical protein